MTGRPMANRGPEIFAAEGLAFPRIPAELNAELSQLGEWLFATRPVDTSPYLIQWYVDEYMAGGVEDYALLAHDGHGINSWAIHYYLVWGPYALFLQMAWGGAYTNAEAAAQRIARRFREVDELLQGATAERFVVRHTDFYDSKWARLDAGDPESVEWHDDDEPLQAVMRLLAG